MPSVSTAPALTPSAGSFWHRCRSGFSPIALIAGVTVFLFTLNFPTPPVTGLDQTWQVLLARAWSQNARFGHDIIFTYGPLGVLENLMQMPGLWWPQVAWQVLSRLAGAVLIVRLLLRLPRWQIAAAVVLISIRFTDPAGLNPPDPYLFLLLFAAGLTLLEAGGKGWRALSLAVLTTLALFKFTLFVGAGFVVAVAVLQRAGRRDFAAALGTGGVFALGFLGLWKLSGQNWTDLPDFVRWSYEVADGYVDAMAAFPGWKFVPVVLFAAALFATFTVLVLRLPAHARQNGPVLLLTAGCFYLAWRHGTVRSDFNHLPGLFSTLAVWPWLLLAVTPQIDARPRLAGLAAGLGAGLILTLAHYGGPIPAQARNLLRHFSTNFHTLVRPLQTHRDWNAAAERTLAGQRAAASRLIPHAATTLVYATDYAELLVIPGIQILPNLQPYSAYTPALARRDRETFQTLAPKTVWVDLEAVDGRLLTAEHLPLFLDLLRNYRWEGPAGHFLLFRRNPQAATTPPPLSVPLATLPTVRFGERIPLTAFGNTPLQMQADLQLTPLGKIIRFFLPLPPLSLVITRDETGNWQTFHRVAWRLAGDGWMLHPFVASNQDLARWLDTGRVNPVHTVACQGFAARWFYREPFAVTLRPLDLPIPQPASQP